MTHDASARHTTWVEAGLLTLMLFSAAFLFWTPTLPAAVMEEESSPDLAELTTSAEECAQLGLSTFRASGGGGYGVDHPGCEQAHSGAYCGCGFDFAAGNPDMDGDGVGEAYFFAPEELISEDECNTVETFDGHRIISWPMYLAGPHDGPTTDGGDNTPPTEDEPPTEEKPGTGGDGREEEEREEPPDDISGPEDPPVTPPEGTTEIGPGLDPDDLNESINETLAAPPPDGPCWHAEGEYCDCELMIVSYGYGYALYIGGVGNLLNGQPISEEQCENLHETFMSDITVTSGVGSATVVHYIIPGEVQVFAWNLYYM